MEQLYSEYTQNNKSKRRTIPTGVNGENPILARQMNNPTSENPNKWVTKQSNPDAAAIINETAFKRDQIQVEKHVSGQVQVGLPGPQGASQLNSNRFAGTLYSFK